MKKVLVYLIMLAITCMAITATAEPLTSAGKSTIEYYCNWDAQPNMPASASNCISTSDIGATCNSIPECAAKGYYPVYGMKYVTNCAYTESFDNGKIRRECLWSTPNPDATDTAKIWLATRNAEPPPATVITAAGGPLPERGKAETKMASIGLSAIEHYCQYYALPNQAGRARNCVSTKQIGKMCGTIESCADLGYFPLVGPKRVASCSYVDKMNYTTRLINRTCVN